MGVIVRLLSSSAISLHKWAERLGRTVLNSRGGVKNSTMNGYLARAIGDASTVVVTVVDPPGQIIIPDPTVVGDGTLYAVGERTTYDSRSGLTTGPYARADIPVATYEITRKPVGFAIPSPDWAASVAWPYHTNHVRYRDRLRVSQMYMTQPDANFEYYTTDQVPNAAKVFAVTDTYPRTGAAPSYAISDELVGLLAPGYSLLCRTSLGYMKYEYQGGPMVTASMGALTLCVVPVVKNFSPMQSVHWGHSGLLFVLLTSEGGVPVVWSDLWTPDGHSSTFFHNGVFVAPTVFTLSGFRQPTTNAWNNFWSANTSGGSRPNWLDAMDICVFNGRFVAHARVCALNGSPYEGTTQYMCGGSAAMRFDISLAALPTGGTTGALVATEVSHEVWAFADPYAPYGWNNLYNLWVAGVLAPTRVKLDNPLGLISDRGRLIEMRIQVQGDRTVPHYHARSSESPSTFPAAILSTAQLHVSVTSVDQSGVELPPVIHLVNFLGVGYGITTPVFGGVYTPDPEFLSVVSPVLSYKLRSGGCQTVMLSENELAILVRPRWDVSYRDGTMYPLSLLVLNLLTGVAAIRGSVGVSVEADMQFFRAPHMDCIQQAVYTPEGVVSLEGVLLVSTRGNNAVRISRDSGVTWEDHISFPKATTGAYYIGNPLMAGVPHGRAIS